jgi:PAS domain S-box-containing protein
MALNKTEASGSSVFPDEEARYQLLFENSLDGIMLTAPDGSIFDANPAACTIMGRTREEILQEGREGLMDAGDSRLSVMIAERQRTGRTHGELTAKRKDGTRFPVEISSVVFPSRVGGLRTCMIIRDITERKAAEAERERLIWELQDAPGRVKTLSGLLPICASCRRIRDQQGAWHNLEIYIRKHTEAEFSHGICPECQRNLYPEYSKR